MSCEVHPTFTSCRYVLQYPLLPPGTEPHAFSGATYRPANETLEVTVPLGAVDDDADDSVGSPPEQTLRSSDVPMNTHEVVCFYDHASKWGVA
jgi:hypothetical protein